MQIRIGTHRYTLSAVCKCAISFIHENYSKLDAQALTHCAPAKFTKQRKYSSCRAAVLWKQRGNCVEKWLNRNEWPKKNVYRTVKIRITTTTTTATTWVSKMKDGELKNMNKWNRNCIEWYEHTENRRHQMKNERKRERERRNTEKERIDSRTKTKLKLMNDSDCVCVCVCYDAIKLEIFKLMIACNFRIEIKCNHGRCTYARMHIYKLTLAADQLCIVALLWLFISLIIPDYQ